MSTDNQFSVNTGSNKKNHSAVTVIVLVVIMVIAFGTSAYLQSVSEGSSSKTDDSKKYDEYFDYILCKSDEYVVGTSRVETVDGSYDLVGVMNAECEWIIEPSKNTFLNPDGELSVNNPKVVDEIRDGSLKYVGKYKSIVYTIQDRLYYAGNGIFVYAEQKGNGLGQQWLTGTTWNVVDNKIYSTGDFNTDIFTLTNGYAVWAGFGNSGSVKLLTDTGKVQTLSKVHCSSPSQIGQ